MPRNSSSPKVSVTKTDVGYDAACDCGFTSVGWPTKREAEGRGDEHRREHVTAKRPEESA